ncbi:MAG: hypothetical protein Q7Q73_02495 [Verrucomicrobiota bacterium JB024]|nr:hypothetical protein [Verrucomicrobiota bacterium JB024]
MIKIEINNYQSVFPFLSPRRYAEHVLKTHTLEADIALVYFYQGNQNERVLTDAMAFKRA